jgi:hypothetical protein
LISHRRREVTEGGLSLEGGRFLVDSLFLGGKDTHRESIAQRSRRAQRRIEVGLRNALWWTAWLLGEKNTYRGKHRTEVTEGTEED